MAEYILNYLIWGKKIMGKVISVFLIISLVLSGCATIINGTSQYVGISSNPAYATVLIDGQLLGKTPLTADLKRKDNHSIIIELDGYMPYSGTFSKQVSGWVFGNILIGGLIGLVIDAISGGIYKLSPDQLEAELRKQEITALYEEDRLFIAVILTPNPDWERIGTMEKAY